MMFSIVSKLQERRSHLSSQFVNIWDIAIFCKLKVFTYFYGLLKRETEKFLEVCVIGAMLDVYVFVKATYTLVFIERASN
jgi:hypothetical protein